MFGWPQKILKVRAAPDGCGNKNVGEFPMSLINQMLQDLDTRRAANGPKSGLPNEVRPLPPAQRSSAPLIVGIGLAVAVSVAWFAWQLADQAMVSVPPPAPIVAQPPDLPPASVLPVPVGSAEPAALPVVPPVASAAEEEARLLMATSLRLQPEREVPPVRRVTQTASPKIATPLAVPIAPAAPVAPVATPPVKATGPTLIEKSAASGSPHERAEGEYRKAVGVLNAGRLTEAIEGLRLALKQDGAHTASRQLLFKLLVENKRLDEAAELLQEGLQLQPTQISWAMSLGRLQVDRGDLPGAWQTLQRSLPAAGNSADYQGFAAHVLQRLGRSKEAVERYQAATQLAPGEGRWWLGLGLMLEASGRVTEARDALLRARATGTLNADLIALVDQKLR
jgi:MSHA biogenesis protein MshN